jgi:hypothetical protein
MVEHPGARPRPLEGPDMVKSTSSIGRRRAVEAIARYRPQRLDAATWAAAKPFVLCCADELGLDGGAAALRVVRVLARIAVWALGEGLSLNVEVVLDPANVERFIASAPDPDRSRATYRSELRRVGPLLTRHAPWESRPAAVSRRQVAPPYSQRELRLLQADATAQPTPGRRRAARALLALGAGAGLDGRWVSWVGAQDVTAHSWGVMVRVSEPATRVVPVLAEWEDEVLELARSAGDEYLLGGRSTSRNRAGALGASLIVGNGNPRMSASRLRSTWLLTHLTAGTRLPELVRAAGLQGVTVVSDLLPLVPFLEDSEALAMLRGTR